MRVTAIALAAIGIVCLCRPLMQCEAVRDTAVRGRGKRRVAGVGICDHAWHRDGRKRLNRQDQRQQHDDEEFAPIGHGFSPACPGSAGQDQERGVTVSSIARSNLSADYGSWYSELSQLSGTF